MCTNDHPESGFRLKKNIFFRLKNLFYKKKKIKSHAQLRREQNIQRLHSVNSSK